MHLDDSINWDIPIIIQLTWQKMNFLLKIKFWLEFEFENINWRRLKWKTVDVLYNPAAKWWIRGLIQFRGKNLIHPSKRCGWGFIWFATVHDLCETGNTFRNTTPAFQIPAGQRNDVDKSDFLCFPVPPRRRLRQPTLMTNWSLKMINNMKSFLLSINFFISSLVLLFLLLLLCSLCWISSLLFLCWQALCSQNALHGESDWRQSVRFQTSTEEDLPEKKAHQTLLNTELDSWAILYLICAELEHDMCQCSGSDSSQLLQEHLKLFSCGNKKHWLPVPV